MDDEAKFLYGVYKEYVWREYDLLEKRANWLYIANSFLLAALIFIFQKSIDLISQKDALARLIKFGLIGPATFLVWSAAIIVPITAIVFDSILWRQMTTGNRALESVRQEWRNARLRLHAEVLPQVSFGFRDVGPEVRGTLITSVFPVGLIIFWLVVLIAMGVRLCS